MPTKERYDIDVSRYEGHTSGNWEVWPDKRYDEVFGDGWALTPTMIVAPDGDDDPWTIAGVERGQPGDGGPDANLIADSPKLLAAYQAQARRIEELEAALEEIEYEDDCVACQEKARAALNPQEDTNADES
jgi:hypothetical protein